MAGSGSCITTLDKRGEPVAIRILFGSFPDNEPDLPKILEPSSITLTLGSAEAEAKVKSP